MEHENKQENNLAQMIQSVLFYLGEPVSFKKLAGIFEVEQSVIESTITDIKNLTAQTGLALIVHDNKLQLVTSPESSMIIEKIRKDEVTKDLSKSALETLSVILYQDNVTRADIDFIRGVNSSFILRNLLIRGLIVRRPHPTDARTFVYTASHDLLAYMGIASPKDLPDFERIQTILLEKVQGLHESEQSEDD